jgi:hypothetical protein
MAFLSVANSKWIDQSEVHSRDITLSNQLRVSNLRSEEQRAKDSPEITSTEIQAKLVHMGITSAFQDPKRRVRPVLSIRSWSSEHVRMDTF